MIVEPETGDVLLARYFGKVFVHFGKAVAEHYLFFGAHASKIGFEKLDSHFFICMLCCFYIYVDFFFGKSELRVNYL